MKVIKRAILTLCLLLAAAVSVAADPGSARSELERFTEHLERFQAEFTQAVKSQNGRIQDQT